MQHETTWGQYHYIGAGEEDDTDAFVGMAAGLTAPTPGFLLEVGARLQRKGSAIVLAPKGAEDGGGGGGGGAVYASTR